MIILLKGGLPLLDTFIDAMAIDNDAIVINLREPETAINKIYELDKDIDENTYVVTFNSVGCALKLQGKAYWRMKGVKLFNFIVDHPIYHLNDITRDYFPGYRAVMIDRGHVSFLQKLLPSIKDAFIFIPHGGIPMDASDKDIDILYAGKVYADEDMQFPEISFVNSQEFYESIITYFENNEFAEIQDAVYNYEKEVGKTFSPEETIMLINYGIRSVEMFFTNERRKNIIIALAKAGLNVHICGSENWLTVAGEYADSITYHGLVSPVEVLKLVSRTKILVNDLPYFADGSHERIFYGALNDAVVISNRSKYLMERFTDCENILFWDGVNTDNVVENAKHVLEDDGFRKNIVNNARKLCEHDTWSDRLKWIVSNL